ncbi:MAG: flippase [Candidatus Methanoculleus thermohydrogenotrophicum]|nr:flippase [Candidatus Methanoculleus thermohydrogenotrophicum]
MKIPLSKALIDVQWAFISIVTASLAHFILRIILGRELGPDGLGVYTLAFTIYLFGMQFAAFGIGSALTKYVAEFLDDRATIRNYVSSGMTSSIITGTLMGVVLFLLAPYIAISFFHVPELEGMIQLTALCYPFIAVQKAVNGTLNGFRRMHLYAFLNIVQNVTVVAASIALVLLFEMGVMGAVIGFVGPTILVSALSPILIRDCIGFGSSFWDTAALRATTVFGFYVVLGNSIAFLNTQVDSILIGYYLNPTEVGIYAVAVLLAQTLTLIPGAVQRVTAPATATLYGKGDIEGVRRLYYSTLKKSLLISAGSAVLIAALGPYIIALLFTEEYLVSYVPLLILLLGYTVDASFAAVGATLSSIGKVHIPFRISTVCGVLNVILNILLIPILGIRGAALATAATMIMSFGITVKIIHHYIGDHTSSLSTRMTARGK